MSPVTRAITLPSLSEHRRRLGRLVLDAHSRCERGPSRWRNHWTGPCHRCPRKRTSPRSHLSLERTWGAFFHERLLLPPCTAPILANTIEAIFLFFLFFILLVSPALFTPRALTRASPLCLFMACSIFFHNCYYSSPLTGGPICWSYLSREEGKEKKEESDCYARQRYHFSRLRFNKKKKSFFFFITVVSRVLHTKCVSGIQGTGEDVEKGQLRRAEEEKDRAGNGLQGLAADLCFSRDPKGPTGEIDCCTVR